MRLRLDPRRATAEEPRARQGRLLMRPFAVAFAAWALAGCDALIPLPDTALLRPQPAPKCEQHPAPASTDQDVEVARLRKLDYEAQCYRHAEMIARKRLGRLQDSLKRSAEAGTRGAGTNPESSF